MHAFDLRFRKNGHGVITAHSALRILMILMMVGLSVPLSAQRKVEYFHGNGGLKEQGVLRKGEKDGEWKQWDEEGRIKLHETYDNGTLLFQKTYSKGQLRLEVDVFHTPMHAWTKTYDQRGVCWHEHYESNRNNRFGSSYNRGQIGCRFTRHTPGGGIHYFTHENDVKIARLELPQYWWFPDGSLAKVYFGDNHICWHYDRTLADIGGYFDQSGIQYDYRWNSEGARIDNSMRVIPNDALVFDKSLGQNFCKDHYDQEGLPHGMWENYYPNGQLWYRQHFEHGRPAGVFESYHLNGSPHVKANLHKGMFHGSYEEWFPDGRLKVKGEMNMGAKNGQWEVYRETGHLVYRASYLDMMLEGLQEEYYFDNGRLKSALTYKDFKPHGKSLLYSHGGVLVSDREYFEGIECAPQREYHQNGQPKRIGMSGYGINRNYDSEGRLEYISYWSRNHPGSLGIRYREGRVQQAHYMNGEFYASVLWEDGMRKVDFKRGDEVLDPEDMPWSWLLHEDLTVEIREVQTGTQSIQRQYFYPTGKLWMEEHYHNGKLEGQSKAWLEDGSVIEVSNWSNGLRDGLTLYTDQKGRKVKEAHYIQGKLSGEYKEWHPQTNQIKEISHYLHGELHGSSTSYSPEGQVTSERNYLNGEEHGSQVRYKYPEYSPQIEYMAVEGVRHGPFTLYAPEGHVQGKGVYEKGKMHGKYTMYDANGDVAEVRRYDYGEQLVDPIPFGCQCDANYTLNSKAGFTPRVQDLVAYDAFARAVEGQLSISQADFDRIFYKGLYFDSGHNSQSVSLSAVAYDSLQVGIAAMPRVSFNLNPCLKGNRFSELHLSMSLYQPHGNVLSGGAFDETQAAYFELAYATHMGSNYAETAFIEGLTEFLDYAPSSDNIRSGQDPLVNWLQQDGINLDIANYQGSEDDYEFVLDYLVELSGWADDIANALRDAYFTDEVIQPGSDAYEETEQRIWQIFPGFQQISLEELEGRTRKQASVQTDLTQMAIDFPLDFLRPIDDKPGEQVVVNGKRVRSRLLFEVDRFGYQTRAGVLIEGAKNFCFTPSEIGRTGATLQFQSAELASSRRGTHVYSGQLEDWSWEGSDQVIFVPIADGELFYEKKRYDLTYANVLMDGEYFSATLTNLPRNEKTLQEFTLALRNGFDRVEESTVENEASLRIFFQAK